MYNTTPTQLEFDKLDYTMGLAHCGSEWPKRGLTHSYYFFKKKKLIGNLKKKNTKLSKKKYKLCFIFIYE